jgi:hypothetical protein
MEQHPDLEMLWQLADTAPRPKGTPRDGAFEPIGLILSRPPRRTEYGSTPANTLAFAGSGGDGVHFNFVLRDGRLEKDSPILLSAPMNFDRPHAIVGRDLRDFLALGVGCGFFVLERLVYDPESFLQSYPSLSANQSEPERELLRLIRETFGVEPWTDPRARLEELAHLESLLEPPAARSRPLSPPPMPSAAAFWQAQLDRERARPDDERDPEREAHMERRLAELRARG